VWDEIMLGKRKEKERNMHASTKYTYSQKYCYVVAANSSLFFFFETSVQEFEQVK
jgi:hypothetical protein